MICFLELEWIESKLETFGRLRPIKGIGVRRGSGGGIALRPNRQNFT